MPTDNTKKKKCPYCDTPLNVRTIWIRWGESQDEFICPRCNFTRLGKIRMVNRY